MYKKALKVLLILVTMWLVSLFTIQNNSSLIVLDDNVLFEQALSKFRKNYKRSSNTSEFTESGFEVWNLLKAQKVNITMQDKLAVVKGYDFPPGMNGTPVYLNDEMRGIIRMMVEKGWNDHAFNQFVSDLIPLDRTLPDPRDKWCKQNKGQKKSLPHASVVICFHNEAWSTLIRTVQSVIMRSPNHLLKEIILFDDFSNKYELQQRLDDYVRTLPKVTLVRTGKRQGLIRARIMALKYVTSPVVVYLDSHCECAKGWLPPLLERIAEDSSRVVSPIVDHIHDNSFEYIPQDVNDLRIGGFNWNLRFTWKAIPREYLERRKEPAAPIRTPTISGGLFAISKKFFEHLGYYDQGFEVWGAENLELSFKTWMCGGSLEIIPCSHVGHVFRKRFPYTIKKDSFKRNSVRLAEVWLDDYAKYFYERIGYDKGEYGNVSERIKLRKSLNCRSFDWYLKKVYIDMEIPDHYAASGQIYSINNYVLCMDASTVLQNKEEHINLMPCHFNGGNQFWVYTRTGEIKRDGLCLDYLVALKKLTLFLCRGRAPSQIWLFNEETQLIKHMQTQKCLRYVEYQSKWRLVLESCTNSHTFKWIMENFKVERLSPELRVFAKRHV